MDDDIDEELAAAIAAQSAETDVEAQWTKAAVARQLLGRTAPPTKIGRFTIVRFVGAGAMGRVFLAYDERLQRELAIKLLAGRGSKAAGERLLKEARALARLSHPNVVQVYEVGLHERHPFIAMEFLRGSTLRAWQRTGPPPASRILQAYLQAGSGLHGAHEQGLIHRDFKPENVFIQLDQGGLRVRVIDFGLARLDASFPTLPSGLPSDTATSLTRSGAIVGTPMYMAPEQIRGEPGSMQSDQFAFCVALAEALWGVHPFAADSVGALRKAQQRPPVLPKTGGSELSWLRPILARGMAPDPQNRFPSMRMLLEALDRDPARRRRRARIMGGAGSVVLLGGVLASQLPETEQPCTGATQAFEGVWSETRRQTLANSFRSLDAVHAAPTWRRISPQLDTFARRWAAGHHDACLAASVRREQSFDVMDRRMLCLDRARQVFDVTVGTLEERTSEILDRADEVTDGLPDLAACASVSRVTSEGLSPPASQASTVRLGRAMVAESNALRAAGRVEQSLEKAKEAERLVAGLGFLPIEAEVHLALGRTLRDAGHPDLAADALAEAHEAAVRAGLTRIRRNAMAERYSLEAERGHFDVCDALEPGVCGGSTLPAEVADARIRRAAMLQLRGRASEATEGFREALQLLESLHDPLVIARARDGLASSLAAQALFSEAEAESRRVIQTLTRHLGAGHPRTAEAHVSLADILRQAGLYEAAELEARKALELTIAVRPPGHPDIPASRRALGDLLWSSGKHAEALAVLQAVVQETEAAFGSEHIATAAAYNNLAGPLATIGRTEDALSALRVAFRIKESTLGVQHPSAARTRDNIASLLRAQGQFDEAQAEHEAALRARVASFGEIHPEVAMSHSNIGALFQFRGDLAAAEKKYAEAVLVAIASVGADHPDVAHYRVNRGNMLVELGRPAEAIPVLRAALRTRVAKLDPGRSEVLDTRNALGRALCRAGLRSDGRTQLEQSLAEEAAPDLIVQVRYEAAFELAKCAAEDGDAARTRSAAALSVKLAAGDGPKGREFAKAVEAWTQETR